jgi:hypothetical protein
MLEPLWSDIFCDSTIIKQRGRASQPLNEAKSPWSYHGFIIFYHHSINVRYPLVMTSSFLLKMVIEIVDLPIEHGDFPSIFVCLPEGIQDSALVSIPSHFPWGKDGLLSQLRMKPKNLREEASSFSPITGGFCQNWMVSNHNKGHHS